MIPIIIRGVTFLVNALTVGVLAKGAYDWIMEDTESDTALAASAEEVGIEADEAKKISTAMLYEKIEQDGGDPWQWWNDAPEDVQKKVEYSPEVLSNILDTNKFAGIGATLAWVLGVALVLYANVRGGKVALSTLGNIAKIRKRNHKPMEIFNEINIGAIRGLQVAGVPGFLGVTSIKAGQQISTFTNTLEDGNLWGRIFLKQFEEREEELKDKQAAGVSGSTSGSGNSSFTETITKTKSGKHKMYLGTLVSGRVASEPVYVRGTDEEITSDKELEEDANNELINWLATLPSRMNWEIQLKNEPFDEYNVKRQGFWLTLSMYMSGKGGKRMFVDEILLGPVEPKRYMPEYSVTESIRMKLDESTKISKLASVDVGDGGLSVTTKEGDKVEILPASGNSTQSSQKTTSQNGSGSDKNSGGSSSAQSKEDIAIFAQAVKLGMRMKNSTTVKDAQEYIDEHTTTKRATSSSTGSKVATGKYYYVDTGGSGLNVRKSAKLDSGIWGTLKDGERVYVRETVGKRDGYTWVKGDMRIGNMNVTAFVAAEFLVEDKNAVQHSAGGGFGGGTGGSW